MLASERPRVWALQGAPDMATKKKRKEVDWSNTPQKLRKRKKVQVSLSDEARAKLARLGAEHSRGQSGVVEDLIELA